MADAKKRVEIDVRTTGAQKAEADLKRLGESGDRGLRAIVGGAEAADAALRLLGPVIGRVTVAATAGLAIRQLVRAGDELSTSLNRLGSATGNVTTAAEVYDRLYAASLRTGAGISDSIAAFTRFSVAARDIGATNDQVLRLIAGIQGFGRLAGTSAAEMSAATLQLGQALASGTLQGDELRSILEAMPQLAQALAGELGLSVGELRKAGSEGRLTADQVFPALLRASEGVQRQLAGLPITLEQGTGILTAAMDRFLGQLDQAIGGSRRLAQSLATAGQALDSTRQALLGPGSQDERFSANAARIRELQSRREALNDPAQNPAPLLGQAEAERERLARIRALDDEIARLTIEQDDIERDRTARRLSEQAEAERRAREQRRSAAQSAYNELREQTDREYKLRKEFSERSALLDRARAGGAISEDQYIADSVRLQAQLQEDLDKLREGAGRAAASATGELSKTLERLREQQFREQASEAQKIFEQTRTPAERYGETIRRLGELLRAGAIDQDIFNRATDQANRTLDQAGASASEVTGAIAALGERLDGAGNEAARTLAKMVVGIDGVRFSLKAIEPGPNLTAKLLLVDAAPDIHAADAGPIRTFDPLLTLPVVPLRATPAAPVVAEIFSGTAALLRGSDGTVLARIGVRLRSADADTPPAGFQLRWRRLGLAEWEAVAGPGPTLYTGPVADGATYELQARSVASSGLASAWTAVAEHQVRGKSEPPSDVENFVISGRRLDWTAVPDLDLAGYRIRWAPGNSVAWGQAQPAHGGLLTASPFELDALPAGAVTLLIKAVDTSGNESASAARIVTSLGDPPITGTEAALVDFRVLGFPGTVTGASVVAGDLLADSDPSVLIWAADAAPMWGDAAADMFAGGGWLPMAYQDEISFTDPPPGAGVLLRHSLEGDGVEIAYRVAPPMWGSGSDPMWSSDAGPMFGTSSADWLPWPGVLVDPPGGLELRVRIAGGASRGAIRRLQAALDAPRIDETFADIPIAAGGTRLPIAQAYRGIGAVTVTLQGGSTALSAKIIDKNPTLGPLVQCFDAGGTGVAATVDALITGY